MVAAVAVAAAGVAAFNVLTSAIVLLLRLERFKCFAQQGRIAVDSIERAHLLACAVLGRRAGDFYFCLALVFFVGIGDG